MSKKRDRPLTAAERALWRHVSQSVAPLPGGRAEPPSPLRDEGAPARAPTAPAPPAGIAAPAAATAPVALNSAADRPGAPGEASARRSEPLAPPPAGERMADLLAGRAPSPPADPAARPPKRKKPFLMPSRPAAGGDGAAPPLTEASWAGVDRRTADRLRRGKLPVDVTLDLHGHGRVEAMTALFGAIEAAAACGQRKLLVITGKGTFAPPGADRGMLKKQLPRWLNDPRVRDRVLAFSQARPEHGGAGAFYVLLRRKRG